MASNKSDASCWYLSARLQILHHPTQARNFCHEFSSTLQVETEKVFWNDPCSTSGIVKSPYLLYPVINTQNTPSFTHTHTYIPKKRRFYEYILLSYSAASFHVCTFCLLSKISLRMASNPQGVVPNCRFEGCESRGLLWKQGIAVPGSRQAPWGQVPCMFLPVHINLDLQHSCYSGPGSFLCQIL